MARELDVSMPSSLDIGSGYSLRITAVDPSSGALIAGVNIGAVTITAESVSGFDSGTTLPGDWFLVPGPGA